MLACKTAEWLTGRLCTYVFYSCDCAGAVYRIDECSFVCFCESVNFLPSPFEYLFSFRAVLPPSLSRKPLSIRPLHWFLCFVEPITSVQWFKYENFGTLIECWYTAARVYVPRLIVLPAYLYNFKAVPNQGLYNKSAWLIVQSFKARVYVQFLACKTAERLTGRLCITKFQNCWQICSKNQQN